jgi:hypothetical protein
VLQPVNHKVELGRRPWSEFLSLLLIATCFRDLGIVWFCPSTRTFTPLRRWSPGIVYLPGGVVVELCFSPSWGCGSSGEIPIFGLPKRVMVTDTSLPRWRHHLGESECGCLLGLACGRGGGRRGGGPEKLCLCAKAAASGIITCGGPMRLGHRSSWLGWQCCAASAAGLSAR